jgi:hypothetical protein
LDTWASIFVSTNCGEVAAVEGLLPPLEITETPLRVLLQLSPLLTLAESDGVGRRMSVVVDAAAGGVVYKWGIGGEHGSAE